MEIGYLDTIKMNIKNNLADIVTESFSLLPSFFLEI